MPETDLRRNYCTVGRSRDYALPANGGVEKPSKYGMIEDERNDGGRFEMPPIPGRERLVTQRQERRRVTEQSNNSDRGRNPLSGFVDDPLGESPSLHTRELERDGSGFRRDRGTLWQECEPDGATAAAGKLKRHAVDGDFGLRRNPYGGTFQRQRGNRPG